MTNIGKRNTAKSFQSVIPIISPTYGGINPNCNQDLIFQAVSPLIMCISKLSLEKPYFALQNTRLLVIYSKSVV